MAVVVLLLLLLLRQLLKSKCCQMACDYCILLLPTQQPVNMRQH
jgi:hypothetical protein